MHDLHIIWKCLLAESSDMLTLTFPLHLLIAASFRSSYFPVKITVPDSRIDNTITDLSNDDTVLLPEITSLLNNSGLGLMKLKMHTDGPSVSSRF